VVVLEAIFSRAPLVWSEIGLTLRTLTARV
jgi:hypothetical protein